MSKDFDCWTILLKRGQYRVEYIQDYPGHYLVQVCRGADVILFERTASWEYIMKIVELYNK